MAILNRKTGETRYAGLILHVRGTFRLDTSMDEVLIWDAAKKSTFVEYLSGSDVWATVDASEAIIAEYYQSIRDHQAALDAINAENLAKSVKVGSTVKVVRGRKVAKGTVAKVSRIVETPSYTMLVLDNGQATYTQNVLVDYKGEFIDPVRYIERKFYFQAL